MADPAAIEALVATTRRAYGRVDVFCSNAGLSDPVTGDLSAPAWCPLRRAPVEACPVTFRQTGMCLACSAQIGGSVAFRVSPPCCADSPRRWDLRQSRRNSGTSYAPARGSAPPERGASSPDGPVGLRPFRRAGSGRARGR
ncbi:MAG: hypothetical protein AB7V74_02415 [Acidimicrobiia bacterium]